MARRPWRPRTGFSGPQPTFAAQGKAPSAGWGTVRAKKGTGSVSREGAFPEGQGNRLVLSSSDEAESVDEPPNKRRRRISASGPSKQSLRATAATARSLRLPSLELDDSAAEQEPLSDVSDHKSDLEPDSDDPDRESSRARRQREKAALQRTVPDRARTQQEGVEEDDAARMRRERAEAALRRASASQVVVLLDSDEEQRAVEEEQKKLEAGQQLVGGRATAKGQEREGVNGGKGKKAKGGMKKGKGRRLVETDESDGVLDDLAAFRRRRARQKEQVDGDALRDKGKGRAVEALFNPDSDVDELDDGDFEGHPSDDDLPSPAEIARRPSTSSTKSTTRRKPRRTRQTPSPAVDDRAARRARTSGRDAAAFINDTDDEREEERRGGGVVLHTGGVGGGTIRLRGPRNGGDSADRDAAASTSRTAHRGSSQDAFEEDEDGGDKRHPAPKPAKRALGRSASGTPLADADAYSHLGISQFVDPRADLAKRKKRALSSPPTSAFSSSDGDDASLATRQRRTKGLLRKERDEMDEFAAVDKRMRRKKREYREERKPGYSNPRRN
ncbi:uncharacterized protein JCM10292_007205 [Rhodotorula paludigena]|uniref:uncharacterized protein n=1 Tax=Rhodotorula paludigena TaxID=86838 RepID=UPI00317DD650